MNSIILKSEVQLIKWASNLCH